MKQGFNKCEEAKALIEKQLQKALSEIGNFAKAESKTRCPVGKYPKKSGRVGGKLKRSISYKTSRKERRVIIGTNIPYARFVHNGTRKQRANPFMENAVKENISEITNIVKKYMGDIHD